MIRDFHHGNAEHKAAQGPGSDTSLYLSNGVGAAWKLEWVTNNFNKDYIVTSSQHVL